MSINLILDCSRLIARINHTNPPVSSLENVHKFLNELAIAIIDPHLGISAKNSLIANAIKLLAACDTSGLSEISHRIKTLLGKRKIFRESIDLMTRVMDFLCTEEIVALFDCFPKSASIALLNKFDDNEPVADVYLDLGAKRVLELLEQGGKMIRTLNLSRIPGMLDSIQIPELHINSILNACPGIQKLVLSGDWTRKIIVNKEKEKVLEKVQQLITHPRMSSLITLHLQNNKLPEEAAQIIAHAKNMQSLTDLDISHNNIQQNGARAIFEHMTNLNSLSLRSNWITFKDPIPPFNIRNIKNLDLSDNWIGFDILRRIADTAKSLIQFAINNNGCNNPGSPSGEIVSTMHNLEYLDISANRLGDAGLQEICCKLPKLNHLDISINPDITIVGIHFLSRLGNLKSLAIRHVPSIGRKEVEVLTTLSTLESLDIAHVDISYSDFLFIKKEMPNIKKLSVWSKTMYKSNPAEAIKILFEGKLPECITAEDPPPK